MEDGVLVYESFQKIIPQTVTVELPPNDDNWLLKRLLYSFKDLGLSFYPYKTHEIESYMSVITLCSNDNVERKALNQALGKYY